jgi:hypothetical protein
LEQSDNKEAVNAGNKFQTGNNQPGCSGPSFWFETTALEMPAGFGRIHHCANLARDGWLGPHLRTGDVTLVFTTDETYSKRLKLLLMGAAVATNSAPFSWGNKQPRYATYQMK